MIKVDKFYGDFSYFKILRYNWSILIANSSALWPSTERVLYFLKSSTQGFSIEYWVISVSGLWAEQFGIKLRVIFRKFTQKPQILTNLGWSFFRDSEGKFMFFRVSVIYLTTSEPTKITWSNTIMSRAVYVWWILGHSEPQNVAFCEMMPYIYI